MEGWICLHREIQDHWIWKDYPYSYGQAWIDLLLLANHEDRKTAYKGKIIVCEKGTVNRSISSLANRWNWSRDKTRRYLSLLENDGMITVSATTNRTTITIVNYSNFQDMPTTSNTTSKATSRQRVRQRVDTNNNDNNDNNNNNTSYIAPSVIDLTLNDGSAFPVTQEMVDKWKSLYPAVDVMQELRKMVGWLDGNPAKRKTKSGINRFVNSWLSREQDKGGTKRAVSQNNQPTNSFNRIVKNDYDFSAIEKMLGN